MARPRKIAQDGEADEIFRLIVEATPNAVVLADTEGRIVLVNVGAEKLFGYNRKELIGQQVEMLVPERFREAHSGHRKAHSGEARPAGKRRDLFALRKDGSEVPVEIGLSPIETPKGPLILSEIIDITERKRTDDQLRTSLKEIGDLKAALDEHAIVAITDPQGKITYVNDKSCAISKYSRQELLGQDHEIINSDYHLKEFIRNLWTTITQGQVWHGETKHRAKDGSFYWVDTTIVPFLNEKGEPRQYVAIGADVTAHKRAQEGAAQLLAIVESSDDAIIGRDLRGIVTSWNAGAEKEFGYSASEMIGQSITRLLPPERHEEEAKILRQIGRGESVRHFETVRVRKDGSRFDVSVTHSAIKDQSGKIVGASKIVRDITERKQAEETLRRQEKQYRVLFETHPSPTWVYDAGTLAFLAVNDAAVQHYGYSRGEFLGMTIRDIRPPEDIPALIDSGTATSDEPQAAGVWRHRKKNGKIILADMYASAIQFEGHSAQLAIAIDVTEQRKAEEAIRQSESRLRALVTSMEDIALEFDGDGTYIAIWTTKDELLPGKRSELIGRRMSDVHGEEVAERFVSAFRRVAESRLAETINYTMDVLEGSRQFLGRMNPIVNADGSCDRVCLLSRDVTEQKKMEAQFLRAQRVESIGTLASGVAHDLNNILAPILMGAATLRYNKMPAADEAILSTIETCAQRGADIVKQVLTFARGAEGERLLLQPARLVNDVARIAAETFPKTIAIRPRFSEGLWPIEGDPTQLHQVLLNLCVNARDAMAGGGMLTILAENFAVDEHYASMTLGAKAGPHVLFEVKDTGTGIPRQIIEKIFDPFFTTKELGHGTGLGLSTVIGIVKSHGGFVSVYSEIGRGTTFKVFLPAQMGAVEALKQNNEIVPARANGELLLIVDDEKPILQVAQALLEAHGYRVLTAGDATEALAIFALRKDEINLVLTDLAMPFMDGVALIRTLKKMKPNVRVIASTGRGDQEQRGEELAGLKVSACLDKPYNKNKLLTTLQDALRPQPDE